MAERPAPLVLVTTPPTEPEEPEFGTHVAIAAHGQRLLAAELSQRLGRVGAAVASLPRAAPANDVAFHWGRWFSAAGRAALAGTGTGLDALGYASGSSLALVDDDALDGFLSPIAGEVVANNRFSADAFVFAGDLDAALDRLTACPSDNAAPRWLHDGGFAWRDLGERPWARFDVDTTLDLALLRLATRLSGIRPLDASVLGFLEMARLPGGDALEVPELERIGEVIRSRFAELVVAGRVPASAWKALEADAACRVRCVVEERGMRSTRAPGQVPRSILAALMARSSPADLIAELAMLGDAVILDTRVLMASVARSSDTAAWPPAEDRFASDFGDHRRVETPWLREFTEAASSASVPFLFGGHALVSDGLRLIMAAAWQGR